MSTSGSIRRRRSRLGSESRHEVPVSRLEAGVDLQHDPEDRFDFPRRPIRVV